MTIATPRRLTTPSSVNAASVKVTKKQPLTLDRFDELMALLPTRGDSEHS